MKCKKCDGGFFELIKFSKYKSNYTTMFGQEPPLITDVPSLCLLKCICGELYEPKVQRTARNNVDKHYDNFLDLLENTNKKEDK